MHAHIISTNQQLTGVFGLYGRIGARVGENDGLVGYGKIAVMLVRDVTIVGAGPAGLAAAIAAKRLGLDYSIIEKGVLVNSIYKFPVNMVFFTTPELLEIGGLPLVSPFEKPTRLEALRYYRRVVDAYELQIDFGEQVVSVEREPASARRSAAASQEHVLPSRHGPRRASAAFATAAT